MRKICAAAAAVGMCVSAARPRPVAAAGHKTPDIVVRASQYVDVFIQRFSNVVAEERYVQQSTYPVRRRELVSDFLLVTAPGSVGRLQFRDVREVDGAAVRDRGERLAALFLEAPADVLERAKDVASQGERYNLADIGTLNQPLLAVGLLQSRYVERFRYVLGGLEQKDGATVRYVAFYESTRPTIIKSAGTHGDFPAHGYFLIEESTGRVVRSELDLGAGVPPPSIVTSFAFDDDLQMNVPVEMHDPLGVATYGRFRQFSVKTDERIR